MIEKIYRMDVRDKCLIRRRDDRYIIGFIYKSRLVAKAQDLRVFLMYDFR